MAKKNFDEERKKRKGHEFTLGGRTFHTYADPPLSFYQTEIDEDGSTILQTLGFIRSLVVAEDLTKWDEMLADSTVYISGRDVIDVSNWLVEVISGRPTKRPPSSGNGAGPTTSASKGRSSATREPASKT